MNTSQKTKDKDKWPALLRGSILSRTLHKQMTYVGLADKRAQGLITISSFLIPIGLSGVQIPEFKIGVIIVIITAFLSIIFGMVSLLPKKYVRKHDHDHLLHFSTILQYSEQQYMDKMKEVFSDPSKIGEAVTSDIYHLSKYIVGPKFTWLRRSFFTFLIGNGLALCVIIFNVI